MRLCLPIIAIAGLLSACGQSNEEQLQDAANQSDPAAAQVLEQAAENGVDPQVALNQAGEAAAASTAPADAPGVQQARPNTAQQPNPTPGQPPEKVTVNGQ